jgi:hypothetical protein
MRVLLESGRDDLSLPPRGIAAGTDGTGQPPLVPAKPEDLAAHYDVTLSHPEVHAPSHAAFERWLAQAAARRGLSCAVIHAGVVHEAIRRLGQGRLHIGFHLDYFALWHQPQDPYACLALAVQDADGRPVNPPARSRLFTDKAAAHVELVRRGLGVPPTVLVRPWEAEHALTPAERSRLRLDEPQVSPGARVYVKAANGFSGRGIARTDRTDPDGLAGALHAARQHDRQDAYLIQREVRCPRLACDDGVARPAYWRILYCLGELIPFWWSSQEPEQGRPSYRRLTANEVRRHRLRPVLRYAAALVGVCRLDWFSTELCLSESDEPSRFRVTADDGRRLPVVAIDYVNDQCDVDVQSRWLGAPPDGVVRYLAERFADAAACKHVRLVGTHAGGRRLRTAA